MDFLGGEMSPSPVASLVVLPTLSDVSYFCFSCFPISWNGESCLQHVRTVQDPDTPWHLQVVSTPALMTCRHTRSQKKISYGGKDQDTEKKKKTTTFAKRHSWNTKLMTIQKLSLGRGQKTHTTGNTCFRRVPVSRNMTFTCQNIVLLAS